MDSTKVEHILVSWKSWLQTLIKALISFVIFEQCSHWSLCLILPYRFSMAFGSGEFPGHFKTPSSLSLKNVHFLDEVWHGAKSCWISQILKEKFFYGEKTFLGSFIDKRPVKLINVEGTINWDYHKTILHTHFFHNEKRLSSRRRFFLARFRAMSFFTWKSHI